MTAPMPPRPATASSPSLFELPVARGPRFARIFVVLTLNVILAGAGAAMIASYLAKRAEAERRSEVPARSAAIPAPRPTPEPAAPGIDSPVSRTALATAEKPAETVLASALGTSAAPVTPPQKTPAEPEVTREKHRQAPAEPEPEAAEPDDSETTEYAAQIDALAGRNQQQLHRCYQQVTRTLAPEQPLEGRVDIRFTIMPDGRAKGGRVVGDTTGSERLGACLVGVVEAWSFPPGASRPLDFVWPFRFRSRTP